MTIEALADLLKRRGCEAVCYFHTDHFEPWSFNIDDDSARAVERMAEMARSSPYARRLSLFYSVFVPYRLEGTDPPQSGDMRVPGDGVVFGARSARQEGLARTAIRPLVATDQHELHLHVHHEFWTRNTSDFDQPVSRWVNACSTSEADRQRLDLHFRLCKESIAREIGMPFERWCFIHGNWALNASDPLICTVNDEMAMMMRHGAFGDFSFPAGRSYCDPKLETPFTCLPLNLPRAYDDPRADPRPIGIQTGVLRPDRFLIWNSPIKSNYSSLDYYSASNRALFKTPERVVAAWLSKSVCLGQKLFIKTHAHSMKWEYELAKAGTVIPHCYPDVVAIFDCLARACDRARIELRLHTVNEVVGLLEELDGGSKAPVRSANAPTLSTPNRITVTSRTLAMSDGVAAASAIDSTKSGAAIPQVSSQTLAIELAGMHREWMATEGAKFAVDELYRAKLARSASLEPHEIALAADIVERYPLSETQVVEIGSGWGGFAILLARLGLEVLGFEGNARRYAACQWHIKEEIRRFPILRDRLILSPKGMFPEAFSDALLAKDKINLCVATNITSSYSAANQHAIIRAATRFDELIIDLARFGQARDSQSERDALFRILTDSAFIPIERLYFREPYEYWRFRSRANLTSSRISPSVIAAQAAAANLVATPPPEPSPARPASPAVPAGIFPVNTQHGPLFSLFGDRRLPGCPVCQSPHIVPLWRMPATNLRIPGTVLCFDLCHECESIFLNPTAGQQKEDYRRADYYIGKMQSEAEWQGYEGLYDSFAQWVPPDATVMIDAACGIGQYLHVARRRGARQWRRLIGLELAEKYVDHMRREGLAAHVFDIDNDNLLAIAPPNSVDFISFCDGFEHVERPLDALRKLMTVLRPGGRLYFTARRYGTDAQGAAQVGVPIYVGEKVVNQLPHRIGCRVIDIKTSGTRYYLVLEK